MLIASFVFRVIVANGRGKVVLKLEGRLTVVEVGELSRVCKEAREALVLDLSDLTSADPAGIRQIQALAVDGAELVGMSRYVSLLLESRLRTSRQHGRPRGKRGPAARPER